MTINTQKLRDTAAGAKESASVVVREWPRTAKSHINGLADAVTTCCGEIDALGADNKQLREALNTIAAYPYARDQEMGAAAMRKIARAALSGEGK
ncbi:hypothetical protein CSC67_08465 [Pusillimonas caeni]|uniref:hypothetical protein n=1 Tax=Pusillimonas caeni TaxID=1348472 RepID=UPI000E59DAE4|nr:hypothetical protein [Pusillimonas caeni]TFL14176.1 hypothetical protein CSC67_08465 [Pusillimonas caeni]